MEGSPNTDSSPDKTAESLETIEKSFYGAFLKLRDGHINLEEYRAAAENFPIVIKSFCQSRIQGVADKYPLKPPYTLEEVDALRGAAGWDLGFLGTYLTEVSRECVFGYHRHVITLDLETHERILGDVKSTSKVYSNPDRKSSILKRIAEDGCAFSKAIVIKGHFRESIWNISDDEPEMIALDFKSWLLCGCKLQLMDMMRKQKIKEAGGIKEYREKQREVYEKSRAEKKEARKVERSEKIAALKKSEKEILQKVRELRKEIADLRQDMAAKQK